MGSFTQLTYHIVFAAKYRRPIIEDVIRDRPYEYVGGTLRAKEVSPSKSTARRIVSTFSIEID